MWHLVIALITSTTSFPLFEAIYRVQLLSMKTNGRSRSPLFFCYRYYAAPSGYRSLYPCSPALPYYHGTLITKSVSRGFRIPEGRYLLADAGYEGATALLVPYRGVRYHL